MKIYIVNEFYRFTNNTFEIEQENKIVTTDYKEAVSKFNELKESWSDCSYIEGNSKFEEECNGEEKIAWQYDEEYGDGITIKLEVWEV